MVLPIGPLMIEHRLIERMIAVMAREIDRITKKQAVDPEFIDRAVDFIRVYADLCHHGKEEKILFRDLQKKELSPDNKQVMDELIEEHVQGRNLTGKLVRAKNKYVAGDSAALKTILDTMLRLVNFYPKHIEKEDKVFFKPAMKYFSEAEREEMLKEEYAFDQQFIHAVYKDIVSQVEQALK